MSHTAQVATPEEHDLCLLNQLALNIKNWVKPDALETVRNVDQLIQRVTKAAQGNLLMISHLQQENERFAKMHDSLKEESLRLQKLNDSLNEACLRLSDQLVLTRRNLAASLSGVRAQEDCNHHNPSLCGSLWTSKGSLDPKIPESEGESLDEKKGDDSVLSHQEGGNHYAKLGHYQPWEVFTHWMNEQELKGFMKGTVIAYLAREEDKGGRMDIRKAHHTLGLYLKLTEHLDNKED